jgi:hypothetical protein
MGHDEITRQSFDSAQEEEELVFARTSERRWFVGAEGVGAQDAFVGDDARSAV